VKELERSGLFLAPTRLIPKRRPDDTSELVEKIEGVVL
jgi:hypothetical protein